MEASPVASQPKPTPLSPVDAIHCRAEAALAGEKKNPNNKKIFVFCDGTGNMFGQDIGPANTNSNVVKLYTMLRVAEGQVAYYHPGVGTMGDPAVRNPVLRWFSMVLGLAFGSGFRANVLDAYRYLMEVYNDGDEIYLFGFSRGAYTARALAAMLHGYGLLCPGNEGHLLYAWALFHGQLERHRSWLKRKRTDQGDNAHRIEVNDAFLETFSRRVTIRFIGVWDTVSTVGWIYEPLRLLFMAENPIVQVGRHAVSIDEKRAMFRDNLWGNPVTFDDPDWPAEFKASGIRQDLAQVWFPGVHSDVGGSYRQDEAGPALESLKWMVGELRMQGAQLCEERVGAMLGEAACEREQLYAPAPRVADHKIHESLNRGWWLLQVFPQQYYDKEDGTIQWQVPMLWPRWKGTPRTIPPGAWIHGSAIRRLQETMPGEEPYRPENLKLSDCVELTSQSERTTANLAGCYEYNGRGVKKDSGLARVLKLCAGGFFFSVFLLLVSAVVVVAGCVALLVFSRLDVAALWWSGKTWVWVGLGATLALAAGLAVLSFMKKVG